MGAERRWQKPLFCDPAWASSGFRENPPFGTVVIDITSEITRTQRDMPQSSLKSQFPAGMNCLKSLKTSMDHWSSGGPVFGMVDAFPKRSLQEMKPWNPLSWSLG